MYQLMFVAVKGIFSEDFPAFISSFVGWLLLFVLFTLCGALPTMVTIIIIMLLLLLLLVVC